MPISVGSVLSPPFIGDEMRHRLEITRWMQRKAIEVLSSEDFGANGGGVTGTTRELQAAINAAQGKHLYIRAGTYIVSALTGVSNIHIFGDGPNNTIIKRMNTAVGESSVLEFVSASGFTVSSIGFDGNKANQLSGANTVVLNECHNWMVENCAMINAKAASGFGSGLVVSGGNNDSAGVKSFITNNFIATNDGDGCYINKEWYIDATGNHFKANGGSGLNVLNFVFPPVANVSNALQITDNLATSNSASGIVINGYADGGSAGGIIYGIALPQSRLVNIAGNVSRNNGSYGIVFQGENGYVGNNHCENNSRNVAFGAGILANAAHSVISNNTTRDNKNYGIDAGGCFYCSITNNQLMNEGAQDSAQATFINVGATVACNVTGNTIFMSGDTHHTGIAYTGIDGDGTTPFPIVGARTKINDNLIVCNSNLSSTGIFIGRVADQVVVCDNYIQAIADPNRAIVNEVNNAILKDNHVSFSGYNGNLVPVITAAGVLVIPDWFETFYVTGTTSISAIQTYSQNRFDGKVRDVQITNQGSQYAAGSQVQMTFNGGTPTTSASAYAEVANGGLVIGAFMTNNGSGYTGTPIVSISGAGAGATGLALVGLNNHEGRILNIIFQQALVVIDGNNLNLAGGAVYSASANGGVLVLRGAYGNWYEVSRSTL